VGKRRILAIGLDGYELSLADQMIDEGLLPHMHKLRESSARFELDHGRARLSGLAWEHVATGKSPEAMRRFSAVDFYGGNYVSQQVPTSAEPFFSALAARTVVFDVPYCDIGKSPNVLGLTSWGAHDPGVEKQARPAGLGEEVEARFPYPATSDIYGFTWPSVEGTRVAGERLKQAVDVRTAASLWLLRERLPDWDLGMVVVSEAHSAIEQMWHGIDPHHDLKDTASVPAARKAVRDVYVAIDNLIGSLTGAFPDAEIVVWAMHGMGTNNADLASMVLLGELLFRKRFGRPYMRTPRWPLRLPSGVPSLPENAQWHLELEKLIPPLWHYKSPGPGIGEDFVYRKEEAAEIEWMPVTRYRPFWPQMEAFAIPSFYDGRARINLQGRDAHGTVPLERYDAVLTEVTKLVAECRDVRTGEPVLGGTSAAQSHPHDIGPTEADLYFYWSGNPIGFRHPQLGQIGPLPYRRSGGHTNPRGFAYLFGREWPVGDFGVRNSLDIVPTLVTMLGEHEKTRDLSGEPIYPQTLPRPTAPTTARPSRLVDA
jgi:predicted AlkP superfamily phosphohydrolase/phosphomutase